MQVFRQKLDVPAQLEFDWFELPANRPKLTAADRTVVINGEMVGVHPAGSELRDGRRFTAFEIRVSVPTDRVGRFKSGAPVLRFAHATEFREDLVSSRVPLDRQQAAVRGAPVVLNVTDLPTPGRPPAFTGAVGRFTVRADASPRELEVGERLEVVLQITGIGLIGQIEPPELELEGFHVFGKIVDANPDRLSVTYHVAPLSADITAVPEIAFWFFDPEGAEYVCVRSARIPLVLRPASAARTVLDVDSVPGQNDIFGLKALSQDRGVAAVLAPGLVLLGLLSPWLFAFALRSWLRRRARKPDDEAMVRARVRDAAAAYRAREDRPGADPAGLLSEFLAATLSCTPAAVIADDLASKLAGLGVPEGLASRAAALVDGMVATRYGGDLSPGGGEAVCELVEEIERALTKRR